MTPATFDEWLAGLDSPPPGQRPGQWAVNTLTPELWTAVNGTPFDAYHINERLPDLIRYARHWWGVMEVSKDGASIPACIYVAVKRGKVPGDTADTAANLVTPLGWPAVGAVAYRDGWAPCRFAHGLALVDSPVGVWVDVADAIWDAALSFPQDSDCDPAELL